MIAFVANRQKKVDWVVFRRQQFSVHRIFYIHQADRIPQISEYICLSLLDAYHYQLYYGMYVIKRKC